MKIGLIGLPYSGKSTLFRLLTGTDVTAKPSEASLAASTVPDPRIDRLAAIFRPRKTTYAQILCVDVPSWVPEGKGVQESRRLLQAVQDVDLLVHVVRAFSDPLHPHVRGEVDPLRDADTLLDELILADLAFVETRLANLESARKKRPTYAQERELLLEFQRALEAGRPLNSLPLDDEQESLIQGYVFYTRKPMIVALNIAEDRLADENDPERQALAQWCRMRETELVVVSAKVEAEIEALPAAERAEFMADLGLDATGIERLARAAYKHLGLISFFTVGEDEVRAWTVPVNVRAQDAARAIHSDIARGFIRAEVVTYDDFIAAGSMKAAREAGLLRLEGKDYRVQDGDIMSFRFNV